MSNLLNSRPFYIGKGFLFSLGLFFGSVTLFLNDKLRNDLERLKLEKRFKEELKRIHSNSSSRYDKIYGRIEVRNKINKYRKILTSYAVGRILEPGCGTGRNFVNYKENDEVVAVDYSNEMLELSNKKLSNKSTGDGKDTSIICKNIQLSNVDCEELIKSFGENTFDSVVDIMNFQAYYNPEEVLRNIKGVLKNNGKLIVICRGESSFFPIKFFYNIYYPTTRMRYGLDYTRNWDDFFLPDKELNCIYKERKNFGKTYLYVFELNKNKVI